MHAESLASGGVPRLSGVLHPMKDAAQARHSPRSGALKCGPRSISVRENVLLSAPLPFHFDGAAGAGAGCATTNMSLPSPVIETPPEDGRALLGTVSV